LVWIVLLLLYVHKWIVRPADAIAELKQPIQRCFIGLVGVATTLIAGAALPHSPDAPPGAFNRARLGLPTR
jgi:tellurite resistance protein